jgi:drug/metabolite transporter (DMT)-like permease
LLSPDGQGACATDTSDIACRPVVSWVAVVCAIGSAACWGTGIVAAKGALVAGVSPSALLLLQLLASLTLLSLAAIFNIRRIPRPPAPAVKGAVFSGVLEYGATYALAAFGLALTTAGNAALIGAAEPALIVLAAALILRERAGKRLIGLLALVTLGLLLVVLPDLASAGMPRFGDLLVLGSAMTGAIYAVLSRRFVHSIAPLPLSLLQQAAGLVAVVIGVFIAVQLGWTRFETSGSVAGLGWAVLSGVLQHGAAVWLHLHALKGMPAGMFALFLALVPVFAVLAATLALGEQITSAQVTGGALIFAAAVLARKSHQPR